MSENENPEPTEDEPQADEDWKDQVQSEKETAADEVDSSSEPSEGSAAAETPPEEASAGSSPEETVPPASFSTLITILAAQAMGALGEGVPGQAGDQPVRLDLARYHIDTLATLEEKTKGNLSDDETALMAQLLHQLRILFVSVEQKADSSAS